MLRQGRMGLGVAFGNMHNGLIGAEESNQLVYLGEKFRRRFGLTGRGFFKRILRFSAAIRIPHALCRLGDGHTRLLSLISREKAAGPSNRVSARGFYEILCSDALESRLAGLLCCR
jgi:hypothetical protein